ncbi:MAG: NAD-dependent epimerase/dehydratase family protein [Alphaproteobacteria bacterium]|nr:NAD-dependent epimerase/dehydratase family protein [Alphaproteobacteria bacterium]
MSAETVCVVGCSGFVGSHVAAELLSRGYNVHGTLRNARGDNARWLMSDVASAAGGGNKLSLYGADVFDKPSLAPALAGCGGVIVCAGSPVIAPETIDLMLAVAENVSDAAIEAGIGRAVFTSSTGSTNPPEGEPALKNEDLHWSDPDFQFETGKFAAVGKTRLDQIVLARMAASDGAFRVSTINPSMIVGPAFQPEPVTSLQRFAAIINGERFADKYPNSSMSMIDARDLAALHVSAMERETASGRYFGVKQSWLWRDILQALERAYPGYAMPAADPDAVPVRATQFDLTRQNSLGVNVRGLDEMLAGVIAELQRRRMI